jgi:hypothetical protein
LLWIRDVDGALVNDDTNITQCTYNSKLHFQTQKLDYATTIHPWLPPQDAGLSKKQNRFHDQKILAQLM